MSMSRREGGMRAGMRQERASVQGVARGRGVVNAGKSGSLHPREAAGQWRRCAQGVGVYKTSEEGGRPRKAGRGRLLATSRYWGSDMVVGRVGQGLHHPTQPREEARQQPAMHAARGKLKLNPLPAAGQDREA